MRDRGKRVMEWDGFESQCRRHPAQKQGSGICPLCLKERLNKLFCPDCGELKQRHSSASSCACSEASTSSSSAADCVKKLSNSNNGGCGGGGGGSVEVGSVGRISFLIESDRPEFDSSKDGSSASILLLRRSKSAAVGSTRTHPAARVAAEAAAKSEPRTPKTTPKVILPKKWYTILALVLLKKKKLKAAKGDQPKEDSVTAKEDSVNAKEDSVTGISSKEDSGPRLSSVSSCGSDRIVVERLVKSRSVAVGRRSFSGYWENGNGDLKIGGAGNVYCTPSRAKEELEVKGSNLAGVEEEISQPRRRSGKGWSWAFTSPMRVFKHSKDLKPSVAASNNPPVAEICRG